MNEFLEDDVTLNGIVADAYEYGDDRIILIERNFGETPEDLTPPKMKIVTNQFFMKTIKNGGNF